MPNNDITLVLDFRLGRTPKALPNLGERIVNMGIQNVGFKAARNRQRRLRANLHRDFAPVVERELQDMARKIASMAVGLANPNNPPPGILSIDGRISRAMLGNAGPMSIASVTGTWALRTKAYMKYKVKKYGTRRWFYNTGVLQKQLRNMGTYRAAYGPMSLRFTPTPLVAPSAVSTLARSPGGQSTHIIVGKLEITPLRRISLSDLPGIGQRAGYSEKLLSPLADSVERKLTGRAKTSYRPVIEPFLTYYLNRKIPNAVYRRLEDSLA